jgi:hypothetical protein
MRGEEHGGDQQAPDRERTGQLEWAGEPPPPRTGQVPGAGGSLVHGRFAPREFLDGIDRYLRLEDPERRKDLLEAIRTRAEQLQEQDKDLPVDPQSEGVLALISTMLAAYEILLPLFDNDQRRTILFLQQIVGAVAQRPFEVAFEAVSKREHPLGRYPEGVPHGGPAVRLLLRHRLPAPGRRHLRDASPSRFFRDHFTRHGNPMLTAALCAWDANWMRAVDPAVSGLRAERTTLMSLGDDACRFRVVATDDPLATYTDVLQQRSSEVPGRSE